MAKPGDATKETEKKKEQPIRTMIGKIIEEREHEGELMTLVSDMKDEVDNMEGTIANLVDELSHKENQIEDLRNANLSLLRKYGTMPTDDSNSDDIEDEDDDVSIDDIVKLF